MNYKNMIENKLKELEGGKFQLLCNDLLERIGYGKVTNSGGQTGTDKTTVGTPDAYILLENGKFIFMEYTTKQSDVCKKFIDDIEKCFDESKTGIKNSEIDLIILAYNSKLSVGDISKLSNLCKEKGVKFEKIDIDNITNYFSGKYPFLAKDYLGLSIDKGQFLDYKTFIYLNDESIMSTPLGLSFHGREENVVELQDKIDDESDVLIVVGKTGVGKTKIICEVLKSFNGAGKYENVWFIKDRGQSLYEELIRYTSTGSHLVFLDDINKLTAIDELLSYISENRGRVKIVATVRDYALETTLNKISKYATPQVYEIKELEDDAITDIVKQNFEIYNPEYLRQISKLAKGNVRLAVMMAMIAKKENTLNSINSIGEIIENYYEFLREKLDRIEDDSHLKALGALSFIDKLHFKSEKAMKIISDITSINEGELVNIYTELHYDEIVDIYENEVVVISDQIVSVFIFRYVYEVRGLLNYTKVLELLFPLHKNRIVQNVNAVTAYYGNIDFFANSVKELWKLWEPVNDEKFRELVLTFWFVNPEQTLIFIADEIKAIPQNVELQDEYLIDNNTKYELILSTLGQFVNDVNIESAIELSLDYLERNHTKIKEISKMLIDYYGYNLNSYRQDYQIQKILSNAIIKRMASGKEVMLQLFVNIASYLLSYCVECTKFDNNKSVTVHWIEIYNSSKMKEIRSSLWIKCKELIVDEKYAKYIFTLLAHYGGYRRVSTDKALYKLDFSLIRENIVSVINFESLKNCSLVYEVEKRYKQIVKMNFPELESATSKSYQIYKVFIANPFDFDDDWENGKQKLEDYQVTFAKELHKDDYRSFMSYCKDIDNLDEKKYSNGEVMMLMMRHAESFIELVEQYIITNTPFNVQPISLIERLVEELGFKEARNFILRFKFDMREYWEYLMYSIAPKTFINQELYISLISYFRSTEKLCIGYLRDLKFLENFKVADDDVFINIFIIIFDKSDESLKNSYFHRLFHYEDQTNKLITEFTDDIKLLENVYMYSFKRNQIYDPNGKICRRFLSMNESLIYTIIDYLCDDNSRSYLGYDSLFDYSIFWEYDIDKILELVEYIIDKHIQFSFENKLEPIFLSNKLDDCHEKRDAVIIRMIEENANVEDKMTILFHIIANFDEDTHIGFILEFLKANNSIEAFKRLPFNKSMESCNGSEVPRLISKREFIVKLLEHVKGVAFLGHRSYLKSLIEGYEESISRTRIREFMQDY